VGINGLFRGRPERENRQYTGKQEKGGAFFTSPDHGETRILTAG
jgi:hypothetical protein